MRPAVKACEQCVWYKSREWLVDIGADGHCHFNPPQASMETTWPLVGKDDFCREFSPQDVKPFD